MTLIAGNSTVNSSITATTASLGANSTATALHVAANGGVGINTTAPLSAAGYGWVTVNGSNTGGVVSLSSNNTELFRAQSVSGQAVYLNAITAIPLLLQANNTEYARITAAGNFGIGNSSPADKLVVNGNAYLTGFLGVGVTPRSNTGIGITKEFTTDDSFYNVFNSFTVSTANVTSVKGHVGQYNIARNWSLNSNGTSTFNTGLYGSISTLQNGITGSNAFLYTAYGHQSVVDNYAGGSAGNTITLAYGTSSYVRIMSSGNIGTAYGNYVLVRPGAANSTVTGNIGTAIGVYSTVGLASGNASIGDAYCLFGDIPASANITGNSYGLYVRGEKINYLSNNVGIGNSTPADKLSVNGTTFLQANLTLGNSSVAAALIANGSAGSAGQVLHSNGTATYWDVDNDYQTNVAAQYTWTNNHTFSVGANAILLNNATSNWIYVAANGAAAPAVTTRSAGTKLVLWPGVSASTVDYGIGIEGNYLWNSVPNLSAGFKWYANTTNFMLANTALLNHTGIINAASHTVGTSFTANSTVVNTASLVVSTNTATVGTGTYFVSNGNVGIANSTPADKLVVAGNITATGTIADGTATIRPLVITSQVTPSNVTSTEFTGIPSWVNRVIVSFSNLSLNGTAHLLVQLGTASGYVSTNYYATGQYTTGGVLSGYTTSTAGFVLYLGAAANQIGGNIVISRMASGINNWTMQGGYVYLNNTAIYGMSAGNHGNIAGALTKIQLISSNGTDTFDTTNGIGIMYE